MAVPEKRAYMVRYIGHVQGVGFRFTVVRFTQQYDSVSGYIKNLPDNSVEMYVEGIPVEAESLLEDIAAGPHAGFIRKVQAQMVPPTGRYATFSVTF